MSTPLAPQVIVLNGGSSSGGSSTIRSLQTVLSGPWLRLGVDDLVDRLPPSLLTSGDGLVVGWNGRIAMGTRLRELEATWLACAAAMAKAEHASSTTTSCSAAPPRSSAFGSRPCRHGPRRAEQHRYRRCMAGPDAARPPSSSGPQDAAAREDWPAWATQPIEVLLHDPAWQEAGDIERQRLQHLLAPWLTADVEHVGSTAVPGLAAKPVIDLQAPVRELAVAGAVALRLAPDGWHDVPPGLDLRDYRRFFVKVADDRRVAHLHLMLADHPRWTEQIAFRDALLAAPDLADEYGALKTKLAREHTHDREAYSAVKTEFIRSVLEAARGTRER